VPSLKASQALAKPIASLKQSNEIIDVDALFADDFLPKMEKVEQTQLATDDNNVIPYANMTDETNVNKVVDAVQGLIKPELPTSEVSSAIYLQASDGNQILDFQEAPPCSSTPHSKIGALKLQRVAT